MKAKLVRIGNSRGVRLPRPLIAEAGLLDPHFHVYYQANEATVHIDTLELGRGRLPRRALVLVAEWALAHREELRRNWQRVEQGMELLPIEPLE